jgi:hypothetical protein
MWLLLSGASCEFAGSVWGAGWVGNAVLIAGYLMLVIFAATNIATTGMVLVAAGLLSNLVVIAVDGGMPVRGIQPGAADGPRHHGIRPGDHLTALADEVRIAPLGETVSAGDIVISIGAAAAVATLMRPRRRVQPASR